MTLSAQLLKWYDRHRRSLPWRTAPGEPIDPYAVWLSEIMLQQTTVKAVAPYFLSFMARWPTVEALAAASWEDVSAAWAGLGYYARARNLHACAKKVTEDYDGRFPDTEAQLLTLPGIGPYTAAAIAAITFNVKTAAIDGNVERVITRLDAIDTPLPGAKPLIRARTQALVPQQRPGDFAQSLMDLGATICTPKSPRCGICPWSEPCKARASGTPERWPVKAPKTIRPKRMGFAFWITRADGAVLLRRRPNHGLLGGMTEIPGTIWADNLDAKTALQQAPLQTAFQLLPGSARHVFTHFELSVQLFAGCVAANAPTPETCWWQDVSQLEEAGLPTIMKKIAKVALTAASV